MEASLNIGCPLLEGTAYANEALGRANKAARTNSLDFAGIMMLLCVSVGIPESDQQPLLAEKGPDESELALSAIEFGVGHSVSQSIDLHQGSYAIDPAFAEVSRPSFAATTNTVKEPVSLDFNIDSEILSGVVSSLPLQDVHSKETVDQVSLLREEVQIPVYDTVSDQKPSAVVAALHPALVPTEDGLMDVEKPSQDGLPYVQKPQVPEVTTQSPTDVKTVVLEAVKQGDTDTPLVVSNAKKRDTSVADGVKDKNPGLGLSAYSANSARQVGEKLGSVEGPLPMRFEKVAEILAQKSSIELPTSVEFRLDPPSLGKMTVLLSAKGDEIVVKFITSSYDAQQALMKSHDELAQTLAERGLTLGGFFADLGMANGQGQHSRTFDGTAKNHDAGPQQIPRSPTDDEIELMRHFSMNYGVFDYRV